MLIFENSIPTERNKTKHKNPSTHCRPIFFLELFLMVFAYGKKKKLVVLLVILTITVTTIMLMIEIALVIIIMVQGNLDLMKVYLTKSSI